MSQVTSHGHQLLVIGGFQPLRASKYGMKPISHDEWVTLDRSLQDSEGTWNACVNNLHRQAHWYSGSVFIHTWVSHTSDATQSQGISYQPQLTYRLSPCRCLTSK